MAGSLEVAAPVWQAEGGGRRAVREEEAVLREAGAEAEEGPIPEGEEAEGRTTYLEMTGFEMGWSSKMSFTRRARSRSSNNCARVVGGGGEKGGDVTIMGGYCNNLASVHSDDCVCGVD